MCASPAKLRQHRPNNCGDIAIFQFSSWRPSAVLDLRNFKFLVASQTVAEISRLTFFKMAAVRHLGFLKIWIFEQPLRSVGPICVTVQNAVKIGQTVLEIFLIFQFWRWRPSAIFDFQNFSFQQSIRLGGPICTNVPNFIKIGQMVADKAFNGFQNGCHPPSWIFLNWNVEQPLRSRGPTCITLSNFIKIG